MYYVVFDSFSKDLDFELETFDEVLKCIKEVLEYPEFQNADVKITIKEDFE